MLPQYPVAQAAGYTRTMQLDLKYLIRDKNSRIVLWQSPNLLLWGWIICSIIALLLGGRAKAGFEHLSTAALFAWASLEVMEGVNYFRRALGASILVVIIVGFFR